MALPNPTVFVLIVTLMCSSCILSTIVNIVPQQIANKGNVTDPNFGRDGKPSFKPILTMALDQDYIINGHAVFAWVNLGIHLWFAWMDKTLADLDGQVDKDQDAAMNKVWILLFKRMWMGWVLISLFINLIYWSHGQIVAFVIDLLLHTPVIFYLMLFFILTHYNETSRNAIVEC